MSFGKEPSFWGAGVPGKKDWSIQSLPITEPVKSAVSTLGIRSAIGASHGTEAHSLRIRCASEVNCRSAGGATRSTTGSAVARNRIR
nr:hypothetical protein [Streptomyces erythrochromogenes]